MATNNQLRKVIAASMAAGIPDTEIAEKNGVTAGYLSQLKQDMHFQAMLSLMAGDKTYSKRNTLLDSIQDEALEKLHKNMDRIKSVNDVLKVFKITNEARREPTLSEKAKEGKVLVLSLPTFLTVNAEQIEHKVNDSNEIIEVNGRSLITQSSDKLLRDLEQRYNSYEEDAKIEAESKKSGGDLISTNPLDDVLTDDIPNLDDY